MNRKENLLWTLYQDLFPKYLNGEIDFFYLDHVREQLFDPSTLSLEDMESEEDEVSYPGLDEEFDLNG